MEISLITFHDRIDQAEFPFPVKYTWFKRIFLNKRNKINDPTHIIWRNHFFDTRIFQKECQRFMEPCEDTINIQTMTTMLMGYKRPEYLAKIGRIQAAEWTIDMLEDAIEQQTPYISDYF